ncbi:single-stranded DNA-binding protein [Flavobacteriaceae bacterium Ap0902]|nr:single-stranded DNA-binding protein [Flavobacteriaceae bacterium Ap0902]
MSGSVNKVILVGNLGDEVKLHYFDSNNCVGRFSMATNEAYKGKDSGERIVHTEWHKIVTRNKLAELCEKYLSKGDQVYIEGRLRTRKWNDNGVDKYQTEVHADNIQFLNIKSNPDIVNKDSN